MNFRGGALRTDADFTSARAVLVEANGRDWAVLRAGLHWSFSDRFSIYAACDLQFNEVQTLHIGSGGLQFN